MDRDEVLLQGKQQCIEWGRQVKEMKLNDLRLKHGLRIMETKLAGLTSSNEEYKQAVDRLHQQLVEKESEISTKENEWRERNAALSKLEANLKLSQSMAKLEYRASVKAGKGGKPAVGVSASSSGAENGEDAASGDEEAGKHRGVAFVSGGAQKNNDGGENQVEEEDEDEMILPMTNRRFDEIIQKMKKDMNAAQIVMHQQDEVIAQLKYKLDLVEREKQLLGDKFEATTEISSVSKQQLMSTAQKTIESLTKQLASKAESVNKYAEMIETLKKKADAQRQTDSLEIERLNELLMKQGDHDMDKLKAALSFLSDIPQLPDGVMSRSEVGKSILFRFFMGCS